MLFFGNYLSFSQGTTEEEFNFITKGYKIQIESGLDMKKGYTFEDYGDWGLTKGTEVRNVEFKGLFRTGQTKPCAIMMIYKRTDITTGATYYLCIPSPVQAMKFGKKALDLLNETITDNTPLTMQKTFIWALMKFSSMQSVD